MQKNIIQYIILFVCLVLSQIFICNHIVLFNVAIPLIFIYLIIRLPMDLGINYVLTISFFSGLIIDIFSDTPGLNALSCTLLGGIRKPLLFMYIQRDDRTKTLSPSISSLGPLIYSKYLLTMTLLYCIFSFTIEFFSFASVKDVLIMSISSGILTFILLLGIDSMVVSANEKRL